MYIDDIISPRASMNWANTSSAKPSPRRMPLASATATTSRITVRVIALVAGVSRTSGKPDRVMHVIPLRPHMYVSLVQRDLGTSSESSTAMPAPCSASSTATALSLRLPSCSPKTMLHGPPSSRTTPGSRRTASTYVAPSSTFSCPSAAPSSSALPMPFCKVSTVVLSPTAGRSSSIAAALS